MASRPDQVELLCDVVLLLHGLVGHVVWPWACWRWGCVPMGIPFTRSGVIMSGPGGAATLAAIAGESANSSARCGSGRRPLHLGVDAYQCTPPTISGEPRNGSTWCSGCRHPHPSKRRRLPVRASHHHGHVREQLHVVWR
jgi:hypothetical protein